MRPMLLAAGFALCAAAFTQSPALAETLTFAAPLLGATEVPANDTTGTGQVVATLDTNSKVFSYTVTYSGLTGPASAAHFHGPAAPGVNAPPVIVVAPLPSPMAGAATLTDAQIADLEAGVWYFNIHTALHPSGEIRGQVRPAP